MKTLFPLISAILLSIFACSNQEETMSNPLLGEFNTPRNSIPFDKVDHVILKEAFDTAFAKAKNEIDAIINSEETPNFTNTIEAMEKSGETLGITARVLFNLNSAETNDSLQALAREISPRLTEFQNDITLNEKLFEKVKYVIEHTPESELTSEQQKLLDDTYKGFVRRGANLTGEEKEKFREITSKLSKLSVQFNENVLEETNNFILHITDSADLAGLPEDNRVAAREEAESRELEGWVFTLQYPSYGPFIKYADNRELRKRISIAYASRGMHGNEYDTREIIKEIANLRLEQAKVLGYDSYADYVLENRMAKTADNVMGFLNELGEAYMEPARKEIDELNQFASELGFNDEIQGWDWSYYSEKLRKERYEIDDEITRPYFQLEKVQEGIFELANMLFGISLKENSEIPVYHPDVKAFEVFDKDDSFLGLLYMDFFPREGKRQGAWMTEYREQNKMGNEDQRPHVSLVFNFSKPTSEKPSLLTFNEVTTFLHEFGHGLHGLLSDVTYSSLAGTNVYRDFVELPSQIMENWAQEKEWLNLIAEHYETGETIPTELVDKIIESKNYLAAYMGSRQLGYGLIDMAWHSTTTKIDEDPEAFEVAALEKIETIPHTPGTAISPGFGHIFGGGYAAGYYGYKWAEVLDADAFALFKENGIFDEATAEKFRTYILSKGGTEDPMELYVKFRGQEPSADALLERSGLKKM